MVEVQAAGIRLAAVDAGMIQQVGQQRIAHRTEMGSLALRDGGFVSRRVGAVPERVTDPAPRLASVPGTSRPGEVVEWTLLCAYSAALDFVHPAIVSTCTDSPGSTPTLHHLTYGYR